MKKLIRVLKSEKIIRVLKSEKIIRITRLKDYAKYKSRMIIKLEIRLKSSGKNHEKNEIKLSDTLEKQPDRPMI